MKFNWKRATFATSAIVLGFGYIFLSLYLLFFGSGIGLALLVLMVLAPMFITIGLQ